MPYGDSPANVAVHICHVSRPFASRLLLTVSSVDHSADRVREKPLHVYLIDVCSMCDPFLGNEVAGGKGADSLSFLLSHPRVTASVAFCFLPHFLQRT